MASLSSKYKRLFLRNLKWEAERRQCAFFDVLKEAASSRLSETTNGLYLTSTSANGASVSYSIPASNEISPTSLVELCSELIDLYETINANSDLTDEEVFKRMLSSIRPIRFVACNFGGLA